MALDLLRCCPQLAFSPNKVGVTFCVQLASMRSLFPSGCQLPFFKQWIYDCKSLTTVFILDCRYILDYSF